VLGSGSRPSLVRTPPASVQGGGPWKPAGAPGPIHELPPNPSGSELTFFCFIARVLPDDCTGTPASVSVSLQNASITADGQSTTTATITVKDAGGSVVTGQASSITPSFTPDPSSPNATVTFSQVTANADGTYSVTITSGTTAGTIEIIAADGSVMSNPTDPNAQLVLKPPGALPAANVSVQLSPATIPADGTTSAQATATVTASDGTPVPGDPVQFSRDGQAIAGAVCPTNASGKCTVSITSTTTAGTFAITATDTQVSPNITSPSATLTQVHGPATNLALQLGSSSIVADGKSTTTVTATVTDANGNPIPGETVNFSPSSADVTVGQTTDNGNGTYTATITSANLPNLTGQESVTIKATDGSLSAQMSLSLTSVTGSASQISLTLQPTAINADGVQFTTATATVKDVNGNPVNGDPVSFKALSNGPNPVNVSIGPLTRGPNGTYIVQITGTTGGSATIFATDTSVTPNLVATANLTLNQVGQAPPGAASVVVSVNPVAISADGVSHAFATAQVDDSSGNPVNNQGIQFFVNGQQYGSICTTDSSGACHITVTSTTVVGTETITAQDISANFLQSSNSVVLSFVPPPPPPGGGGGNPGPGTNPTPTPPAHSASGPSASKIKASLASLLSPKGTSIRTLLKKGSYKFSYEALVAGELRISWLDGPSPKKQTLIGTVTVTVGKAKKLTAKLRLTSAGRAALRHAKQLAVKSAVSFKPSGKPPVSRSATFRLH